MARSYKMPCRSLAVAGTLPCAGARRNGQATCLGALYHVYASSPDLAAQPQPQKTATKNLRHVKDARLYMTSSPFRLSELTAYGRREIFHVAPDEDCYRPACGAASWARPWRHRTSAAAGRRSSARLDEDEQTEEHHGGDGAEGGGAGEQPQPQPLRGRSPELGPRDGDRSPVRAKTGMYDLLSVWSNLAQNYTWDTFYSSTMYCS